MTKQQNPQPSSKVYIQEDCKDISDWIKINGVDCALEKREKGTYDSIASHLPPHITLNGLSRYQYTKGKVAPYILLLKIGTKL